MKARIEMKHKHADIMMEYAQVAQESETPWEEFEFCDEGAENWRQLVCSPIFCKTFSYRRKPKMSKIGDYEYPAAETKVPVIGSPYFYPCVYLHELHSYDNYEGYPTDDSILLRGMLHLTKENAIAHAKAIILASGGKV